MPAKSPEVRVAAATVAALSRSRTPDDPELVAARRALKLARIQERVEEFSVEHPGPLSQDEIDALTGLLRARADASTPERAVV